MKNTVDLLNGDIDKTLRQFSIPLIFSFILNILYSWVDKYFVSKLGDNDLAAVGVSEQLLLLIFTLGIGFAIGSGVVVARRIGEAKYEEANSIATMSIVIMFFYSLFVSISFYLALPYILDMMGYKANLKANIMIYMSAVILGFPFNFLTFQINAMVRSIGNTTYPMMILVITVVLNAIFTPILIFGWGIIPAMGLYGAGLGTAIAQLIGCIISIWAMVNNYTPIVFKIKDFRLDKDAIWLIFSKGIPSTFQYLSLSSNRLIIFALANNFGPKVVASYTLGLSFDLFVFMPVFATGIGLEIITGQNLGAKNPDRVLKYFYSAVKQLGTIMLVMGFVAYNFGHYFATMFTNDQEVIIHTTNYLQTTSFTYLFFAIGILTTRVFSGAGDTMRSLAVVSIFIYLIQIPLSYLLSIYFNLGPKGLWLSISISLFFFAILGTFNFYARGWLKKEF
ncbi:MAG: MATE family efflux transporter [Candidatus Kapaibacteriota bacterium]|jgi:putative MATE family efflux protein